MSRQDLRKKQRRGVRPIPFPQSLPDETVRDFAEQLPEQSPRVQSRKDEKENHFEDFAEMRAVLESDNFWELAALFPNNDIHSPRFGESGAPRQYPDYIMLFLRFMSQAKMWGSQRGCIHAFFEPARWEVAVKIFQEKAPSDWTRPDQLQAIQAGYKNKKNLDQLSLKRVSKSTPEPPQLHHLSHFNQLLRGKVVRDDTGRIVDRKHAHDNHPYIGLLDIMSEVFSVQSVQQAQDMGMLNPEQAFNHANPQTNQFVGFDGVVFRTPRRKNAPSSDEYTEGGSTEKVHGTKMTIASIRKTGQYQSQVILGFLHNGKNEPADRKDEGAATITIAKQLLEATQGGMKGIVVDSVLRGKAVVELQRKWIPVVNYPHAHRNPDRAAGRRLNDTRVEKNHLALVVPHENSQGQMCKHMLYWVGGEIAEATLTDEGGYAIKQVKRTTYKRVGKFNKCSPLESEPAREYVTAHIECEGETLTSERIPMFHAEGPSSGLEFSWGEYARTFAPSSEDSKTLYATRNDTESRHTALKRRIRHMPEDVDGQNLNLLAAAFLNNAITWQFHLRSTDQAHHLATG